VAEEEGKKWGGGKRGGSEVKKKNSINMVLNRWERGKVGERGRGGAYRMLFAHPFNFLVLRRKEEKKRGKIEKKGGRKKSAVPEPPVRLS